MEILVMPDLKKQIAVVTGASGGIGGAIATAFIQGGAHVVAVGRDIAKLEALVTRLRGLAGIAEAFRADLTQDDDLSGLAEYVSYTWGRLDILVHSAGAYARGKLEKSSVNTMDALYASNVRGPYLLTKELLPLLKRPRGQITFINSSAGLSARPEAVQFSATQQAFKALADGLRDEVNADQVRVLSVYPGRTATARIEALTLEEGRPYQPELLLRPEDVASVVANAVTLPWTAEVTDISIRPMQKSY
jgi:NADP-dependent 3-hydroxy acid dehydrogenase YdfG